MGFVVRQFFTHATQSDFYRMGWDQQKPHLGQLCPPFSHRQSWDIPHNIMSVWSMLGSPGFLLILALVLGATWQSMKVIYRDTDPSSTWVFGFVFGCFAIIQLIFSKSAFVEWLPLAFASVVAAKMLERPKEQPKTFVD